VSDAGERGNCVHEIVLGAVGHTPKRVALYATVVAIVLHVGGVALAIGLHDSQPTAARRESRPLVVFEHIVELEPPPVAPPAIEPPPPPPVLEPPRVKAKAKQAEPTPPATPPKVAEAAPPSAPEPPPEQPPSEPPPAAQAAQVVAAAASAQAAPSFTVASGSGSSYAGGTTSAQGSAKQANHTGQVGVGTGTGLSRAQAAQLKTRSPPCGWPDEAEESDLEEAFVTMRVSLHADGSVADVQVLTDPGYGFAKRSEWCARSRMKFEPARDASGAAVAGSTPPLRVRFVREE